jgi:hypothetical protein
MRVGHLLNKDTKKEKELPEIKNKCKIEKIKLKEKNKEIELNILLKKSELCFKEINHTKSLKNLNDDLDEIHFSKKGKKSFYSVPKNNYSLKIKASVELPTINVPKLKLDLQEEEKEKNNNQQVINSCRNKIESKDYNMFKSNSMKRLGKSRNELRERMNRRYNNFDKTLNKLKKSIFSTKNDENKNFNNNVFSSEFIPSN